MIGTIIYTVLICIAMGLVTASAVISHRYNKMNENIALRNQLLAERLQKVVDDEARMKPIRDAELKKELEAEKSKSAAEYSHLEKLS